MSEAATGRGLSLRRHSLPSAEPVPGAVLGPGQDEDTVIPGEAQHGRAALTGEQKRAGLTGLTSSRLGTQDFTPRPLLHPKALTRL